VRANDERQRGRGRERKRERGNVLKLRQRVYAKEGTDLRDV